MKATQKVRITIDDVSMDTCVKNVRNGMCNEHSANLAANQCLRSFEKFISNDFTVGISGVWNGHRVTLNII